MKKEYPDENTYTVKILCDNCGAIGEQEIPKGSTIEGYLRMICCTHCGCYKLLERREV